jgi:hypothetical protein
MRPRLILYVASVIGTAAALLAQAVVPAIHAVPLGLLGFWLVLSLAAECFWLETPTGKGMVSTALAINMAMIFVLPPPLVLVVGAVSVGLSDLLLHRRGALKASFNAAQTTIALAACHAAMRTFGRTEAAPNSGSFLQDPGGTLVISVSFYLVNTVLVAGAISLQTGTSLWGTWRANYGFGYQILASAVLFLLGMTLVLAYHQVGYIAGLGYLLFFYFVRDAYHRYVRERRRLSGAT